MKLYRTAVDPGQLLESAREGFVGRGSERIAFEKNSTGIAFVDRELITLAIRQVLDNAMKYSDPSSPVVCRTIDEPDALIIRIADQGPGIPERDADRVFDKFYRRPSVREHVPGSGLGLHIAREITRMHDGDLWVEPGTPRGAVFCFRLPRAEGEQA